MEMPNAIVYLLESSACFTVLFGLYLILFRRQAFPVLNRMVLIAFVLISMLIPLLTITHIDEVERKVSVVQSSEYSIKSQDDVQVGITTLIDDTVIEPFNQEKRDIDIGSIMLYVYLVIAGYMLLRFVWTLLLFLIELKCYSKWELVKGQKVAVCNRRSQTFSFFNVIVLSEKDFYSPNREVLICHEKVHSQQFHSLDLLIAELFMVLHWFNPLVYLLKPSLSEVHEYLADGKIVSTGTDTNYYKHLIVESISNTIAPKLSNSFSAKTLKNRLNMLSTNHPKGNAIRYLAVIPMVIMLMAIFSFKVESREVFVPYELPELTNEKEIVEPFSIDGAFGLKERDGDVNEKDLTVSEEVSYDDKFLKPAPIPDADSTILYKRLEGIIGKDKAKLLTIFQTKESNEIFRSFNIGDNTPFYIISITKNKPKPIIELINEETKAIIKPVSIQVNDEFMQYDYLVVESGNYRMNIPNSNVIDDYLYCVAIPKDADGNIDFALNVRDRKVVLKSKATQGVANVSIHHKRGDSLEYKAGEKADSLSGEVVMDSTLAEKDLEQKAKGNWTEMEMRREKEGEPDYFAAHIKIESLPVPSKDYIPNLQDTNFSRMGDTEDNWPITYIRENLVYPKSYRPKRNKLDKVEVEFSLSERGEVSNVKVVKGVSPEVDAELVRVISAMPGWQPERPMGTATSAVVALKFMLIRKQK